MESFKFEQIFLFGRIKCRIWVPLGIGLDELSTKSKGH